MRLSPRDRQPPPAPAAVSAPMPPGPLAVRRRARRGLGAAGLASAVLHALVVAAVLLEIDPRGRPPQPLPPPSFAVVFQGGSDQAPRGAEAPDLAPAPTIASPPVPPPPPPPMPAPAAPAAPPVVPAPPPPPVEAPPTRLAEAPPVPPPPAPAPPAAPPPVPLEPPPGRPTEAAPPSPALPAPPRPAPAEAPPTPPPPQPPTPPQRTAPAVTALPLPPPPPPVAPPAAPLAPRQVPLDLTDRPPIRLGEADPSRPGAPRRGLDLRPGASLPGPGDVENLRVRGAEAGPDWRNAFRQWLDRNLRYPREAAELGEQGPVTVRIITGADGRVRGVELRTPSRSIFLNHYSQAVFRGASLPPFPPGTAEEQVTIDLTIHYILYGR